MKLTIRHQISIGIGAGAARAVQHLLMTPRNHMGQTVHEWAVDGPGVTQGAAFNDAFGNQALLVNQTKPEGEIVVSAAGIVETTDRSGVVGRVPGDPVPVLFTRITALTPHDETLTTGLDGRARDRVALFHTLMARVGDGSAAAAPQAQEQMQAGGGQSQSQSQSSSEPAVAVEASVTATELTHRFIGALRGLKIPARYVTGYLAADDESPAAFHGWAEAYDEGLGWIGFDCALQLCPTERHVRLAIGLDASSAAPVRSVPSSGAPTPLTVAVEAAQ